MNIDDRRPTTDRRPTSGPIHTCPTTTE